MIKIYSHAEATRKVEEILAEVDFNGDGSLNFSEFITATMKKEQLLSEEMLKKAFDCFDLVRILLLILGWQWVYYY